MKDWLSDEEEEADRIHEPALLLEAFVVAMCMIAFAYSAVRTLI